MEEKLQQIVEKIENKFHPVSILIYGSRARTDYLERSDYEIGVLYESEKKISRTELKELNPYESINLYPFEYESFIKYKIDTPFPENIYFRELILGGKTISGKKVIENLTPPPVKVIDLLQLIRFNTGFALAAVLSHRGGDRVTAAIEFSKSCLFGTRCLIILRDKKFPISYDDIYDFSTNLKLDSEHAEVIKYAIDVRKGTEIQELQLYKNISLLNAIKDEITELLSSKGNIILLS